MKIRVLIAAAALWLASAPVAEAQTFVVAACPTTGSAYPTGSTGRPYAIDPSGNVCIAGTISATITFPTFGAAVPATGVYTGINVGGTLTGATGGTTAGDNVTAPTGALDTRSFNFVWDGATWDRLYGDSTNGAFVNIKAAISLPVTFPATPSIANLSGVVPAPSSEALAAIAHSTSVTAAESCRVLKASAGNLYALRVSIAATTGYVMVFDATSAPGDGAVTTLAIPAVRVVSDGTSGWYADDFNPPMRMATGITVCFSSTGPFSKTASATAAIAGQTQ